MGGDSRALADAFGPDLIATVVRVVELISEGIDAAGDGNVGEWVQGKINEFIGELKSIANDVWDLVFGALTSAIPPLAIKAIAKLAAKFIPAAWVTTVVDIVLFFFNDGKRLLDIFNQVAAIFLDLIKGGGNVANKLADNIDGLIRKILPTVFSALATIFGIDGIPKAVRTAVDTVRDKIQSPVKKVLNAIAKPIKKTFQAIVNKLTGKGGKKLASPQRKANKKTADDKEVKVWLATGSKPETWVEIGNKSMKVSDLLKCQKPEKKQEGQTLNKKHETQGKPLGTAKKINKAAKETKTSGKALAEFIANSCQCCEGSSCPTGFGTCFGAGTLVHRPSESQAIESFHHCGVRVITTLDSERGELPEARETFTNLADWQEIHLVLHHSETAWVDIQLLRGAQWFRQHQPEVGGTLFIDMPEMGVSGNAYVNAINEHPEIEEGPGRLVTGIFRHSTGQVYDLKLKSEQAPLRVTGSHPVWSVDRKEWIPAAELNPGETLRTLQGTTMVEGVEERSEPEPVYNLEVDVDHVYRVGDSGVLVHNASLSDRAVWNPPKHESCPAVEHCPQLDGSSGFSSPWSPTTQASSSFFGIILDSDGVEVERYKRLPTGFKAKISSTGGGSPASPQILPTRMGSRGQPT